MSTSVGQVSPDLRRRLAAVRGVILDVDGCLVLSDAPGGQHGQALPGAADTVAALRAGGRRVIAFTNASNQVPAMVAASLAELGIPLAVEDVLTPSVVAAEVIPQRYGDRPVLAFGGPGLLDVLAGAGVRLAGCDQPEGAAAVLVGWDVGFDRGRLQCAAQALWAGADLMVTSDARQVASRGGALAGLAGFIVRGLSHVGGRDYEVLGKPSPAAMAVASRRLGVPAEHTLIVGDDLTLDIRMARSAGAVSALLTTGLHGAADVAAARPGDRPDLVLDGLTELMALWRLAAGPT